MIPSSREPSERKGALHTRSSSVPGWDRVGEARPPGKRLGCRGSRFGDPHQAMDCFATRPFEPPPCLGSASRVEWMDMSAVGFEAITTNPLDNVVTAEVLESKHIFPKSLVY